jgi:hypothetical protein
MGGKIVYGDYFDDSFVVDDRNAFSSVLNKRISFSYENEYRLVYWDTALITKEIRSKNGYFMWDDNIIPDTTGSGAVNVGRSVEEIENLAIKPGLNIECDINELIESTFLSPLADDWLVEVVKNASKKYGLEAPISKSELTSEPLSSNRHIGIGSLLTEAPSHTTGHACPHAAGRLIRAKHQLSK